MEWFLADCSAFFKGNTPVLLSLFLAGLIGSASHCSVMCSPLVAAQMLDIKKRKQSQSLMAFYHAGRLSTYMALGILVVAVSQFAFSSQMVTLSHIMMVCAGIIFVISAMKPRKTHACSAKTMPAWFAYVQTALPAALVYYLRGVLMGFMPCGMVIAALMMVATMPNMITAAIGMVLFGLATVPLMQLAGLGALSLSRYFPTITNNTGRAVMACNGLFLCSVGLNMVSVN
ncbi:MAG: sulfite exporter TauE/SafE family protein [Rickettsiales bacterium]|nr:sulfite exporter TauE/SafE family protein [Rickettsiales bacterium]